MRAGLGTSGGRAMVAALGVLALVAAASPAAALAEKSAPRVIYVHPTYEDSNEAAGPKPEVVRPHVYAEPKGMQPEVVIPPDRTTAPQPPPAVSRPTPKSIQASRFDVINEAAEAMLDTSGSSVECGLQCQRDLYELKGSYVAMAGRLGDAPDWLVRVAAAQMKEIRGRIDQLQNGTPGESAAEPSFVDDLKELWEISGQQVQRVLAPIIVTELISGLFGTAPACGVEKLPSGQPTCVK